MDWYLHVLKNYFKFSGRVRRKEYWMFCLFHILFSGLLLILYFYTNDTSNLFEENFEEDHTNYLFLQILGLYTLATVIPSLALSSRRMHDLGKSGAWFLINFIPYIGSFWFLILTCMDGEAKTNKWGENPKGIGNNREIDFIGQE
ncbi:DUF805 domain-containing protein [uncultured Polaribacter sp.]|uniref:DUF805 domain-containing protein n=1 Tax=uncultured Polaribacter sp. TaxID=174711 RepID=UPI0026241276|nr:DUF805 domain-containing protein [uncultured Polaribacter sp.]